MNIDNLKSYLEETAKLFNSENVVTTREAASRSGRFLEAQSHILFAALELSSQLTKLTSLRDIKYAQLLSLDPAKNVTEKKSNVEAHPDYVSVREQYDDVKNQLDFLKGFLRVLENSHIFFRSQAKPDLKGELNG